MSRSLDSEVYQVIVTDCILRNPNALGKVPNCYLGCLKEKLKLGPKIYDLPQETIIILKQFAFSYQVDDNNFEAYLVSAQKPKSSTWLYGLMYTKYENKKQIEWIRHTNSVSQKSNDSQVTGKTKSSKSSDRVQLDGGVLKEELLKRLNQFAYETDTYIKSSMGNSRSATRNKADDKKTSQHYTGSAFDFYQYDTNHKKLSAEESADLAYQSKLFHAIEISLISNFVHVDIRSDFTGDAPYCFQQMSKDPYIYKYTNDSPFWSKYSPGKYLKYPKK